jgi:hypothetical protein
MKNKRLRLFAIIGLLAIYVTTYFVMSRRGYQQSRAVGFKGFFFVLPHNEWYLQINRVCQIVFYPLVQAELMMGTGEHPAGEPLQGPK